jgi:alpha-1,2-mannosyltransferase
VSTSTRVSNFASGRRLAVLSAISALSAVGLAIYLSRRSYQVDIDVYLMGGKHSLLGDLYAVQFGRPFLRFTYPPFAALVFWPMAKVLSLMSAQTVWAIVNVGTLFALIVTSIRLLRPDLDRALVAKWSLAALLPALLLNPVFLTVGLGQVNLILCLGVLWDLAGPRRIGRFTIPQGVVTGIAAAIKLTPLIFIPYLVLTGRRRAAISGSITFAACSVLGFALAPQVSWAYWTRIAFQTGRAGALFQVSDQNLLSSQSRFDHAALSASTLWPLLILIGVAGLVVAAAAHRWSSPFLGLLVCATTGLLISPITWTHHLVWVLPLICWLMLAHDRPRHGAWWAGGVAMISWMAPIWWVPTSWWPTAHPVELTERGWQLIAGNSFFLGMMIFLIATAIIVWRRRPPYCLVTQDEMGPHRRSGTALQPSAGATLTTCLPTAVKRSTASSASGSASKGTTCVAPARRPAPARSSSDS